MRIPGIVIVSFLIAVVLPSCDEEASKPELPPMMGIEQFPLATGNQWTYVVSDSVQGTTDTVTVEVTPHGIAEPPFRNVWIYSGGKYTDTTHVAVNGDSVFIYDSPTASQPGTIIVFPLEEGASWGSSGDTSTVHMEANLQVPIGSFTTIFRIDRNVDQFNYTLRTRTWIAPDVGIVMAEKEEMDFAPLSDETWRLTKHTKQR